MRRVIGLTLAGVGTFLVVVALLLPTYVAGQVIKFPNNEYFVSALRGTGAYFSRAHLAPVTGAAILVTDTVKGDTSAGTSSTAVWNEFTDVYDVTNRSVIGYSARRAAFDRRTGAIVACCGSSVNGDTRIRQSGESGYVWPLGTQKRTYYVFDTILGKPMPYRYAGTATISGIDVYRFTERVPATRYGTLTLPAALLGGKATGIVTLPEYYTATNTDWVDPETGAILQVSQSRQQVLRDGSGALALVLFSGDLAMTPRTVAASVSTDSTARTEIMLVRTVIPLAAGLAGLVALLAGIILARPRRDQWPDEEEAEQPEPVLDPAI